LGVLFVSYYAGGDDTAGDAEISGACDGSCGISVAVLPQPHSDIAMDISKMMDNIFFILIPP